MVSEPRFPEMNATSRKDIHQDTKDTKTDIFTEDNEGNEGKAKSYSECNSPWVTFKGVPTAIARLASEDEVVPLPQ